MSFGGWTPSYERQLLEIRQFRALDLFIPVVKILAVIQGFHCDVELTPCRHHQGEHSVKKCRRMLPHQVYSLIHSYHKHNINPVMMERGSTRGVVL